MLCSTMQLGQQQLAGLKRVFNLLQVWAIQKQLLGWHVRHASYSSGIASSFSSTDWHGHLVPQAQPSAEPLHQATSTLHGSSCHSEGKQKLRTQSSKQQTLPVTQLLPRMLHQASNRWHRRSTVSQHTASGMMQSRWLQSIARLPVERLQQTITPEVCSELTAKGYAVVDGVFGAIASRQLELELMHVWSAGLMHLNHTHLVNRGETTLLAKSQVMEAELTFDPQVRAAAPLVSQLDADSRLRTMLNLFMPQLRLESHAIKMQHNEGSGGCFPMHFDSDETLDGRRVTAIMYLNQEWKPSHGGELRLYPFPGPPVDVEPLQDRLVLFSSTRMLHRVLPSRVPRNCFTIWLSEGRSRAAGASPSQLLPPPATGRPGGELWRFLMQPAVRQHVCKLAYAEEWEQSILDSHPACPETDAALAKHRSEVESIAKALGKLQPGLQQLLDAAATVAAAAATTAQDNGASSSRSETGRVVSEQGVQDALGLLRQVAVHVNWF